VENNINNAVVHMMYTEEQLMARLKFFIGICLALTLTGIVFVVLYSIIFITQPLNAISPIDQKFFEMIIPIATFLTGTLSGIMLASGDKNLQAQALAAANRPTPVSPAPNANVPSSFNTTPSVYPTMPNSGSFGTFTSAPLTSPQTSSYTSGVPSSAPMVTTGFGGKLAPPPAFQPEI
jgi:hypothetical protein